MKNKSVAIDMANADKKMISLYSYVCSEICAFLSIGGNTLTIYLGTVISGKLLKIHFISDIDDNIPALSKHSFTFPLFLVVLASFFFYIL